MKNLIGFIGLFIIALIAAHPLMAQKSIEVPQVQVGTFSTTGASLASGSGDRQITVAVNFPKPFNVKPDVIVSITTIDAETKSNVRVNVKADGVSRDGFTVVVKTWADSKVHNIQGSWVAVAPTTVKVK